MTSLKTQCALFETLQPHIELAPLLESFFTYLNEHSIVEGLYFNHIEAPSFSIGSSTDHSQQHQPQLNGLELGTLILHFSKRATESEIKQIDQSVRTLIHPLNNALRFRNALRMALIDPLTGTQNRIGLDACLEREVALARRHDSDLSILIVDIDHFKNVNDSHGHLAGDKVLCAVADALLACTRQTDALFRYGGEEFALILPQTNLAGSQIIAERIRNLIQKHSIEYKELKLTVSVSIGAAQINEKDSLNTFFDRADSALYCAKHSGRNQVSLAK